MKRLLTWTSLALLLITLLYWFVAARAARDFRSIGDGERFRHAASFSLGGARFSWVVDRSLLLVACVTAESGSTSFLLNEREPVNAMLSGRWKWHGPPTTSGVIPFAVRTTTFESDPADGPLVTLRLVYAPLWLCTALFAILPAVVGLVRLVKFARRQCRAFKVRTIRRARLNLGRCRCGYDLRSSHGRCPECGRVIRWVPVSVPTRR